MYVAIPNIKDMNQNRTVMSISLFLLLHDAISAGCRAHAPTKTIPNIIAMAPGIA